MLKELEMLEEVYRAATTKDILGKRSSSCI